MTEFEKQAKQSLLVHEVARSLWQISLLAKGVERPAARFDDLGLPNVYHDTASQVALKFIDTAQVIAFQKGTRL